MFACSLQSSDRRTIRLPSSFSAHAKFLEISLSDTKIRGGVSISVAQFLRQRKTLKHPLFHYEKDSIS